MQVKKVTLTTKAESAHCRSFKDISATCSCRGLPLRRFTDPPPKGLHTMQGRRLSVITLNLGGLSQVAWDELRIWLHQSCEADVLLLQETHWGFANLFDVPKFWVVHSGASDHRFQGCAVMIRKTLAEVTALRWAPVIAGHILHVRFPYQGKHVDVICMYQFSWSYAGDAEALRAKRERIWIRLDKLLSSLQCYALQQSFRPQYSEKPVPSA